MSKFIIGLDLGQAQDFTAISILEVMSKDEKKENVYGLRHLERFKDVPYPAVVKRVEEIVHKLSGDTTLVIDATGCGLPVVDMFRTTDTFRSARRSMVSVFIHGGDHVSFEGDGRYRSPKRDLVAALQIVTQTNRLKIPLKLRLSQLLQGEMLNFKVKIDPATAHDSYSAWREKDHDDMVLSVALAIWWAETQDTGEPWIPQSHVTFGGSQPPIFAIERPPSDESWIPAPTRNPL